MEKENVVFRDADNYFKRNKKTINGFSKTDDFVFSSIKDLGHKPKNVLELGCSNGFRLNWLYEDYRSSCFGIDPSRLAIEDGKKKFKKIKLYNDTFDHMEKWNKKFDLIIIGFFVYLLPRDKLSKLIYEVDKHLEDNGYVIIYDFYSKIPFVNKYSHNKKLNSFKFDLTKAFTWNPQFMEVFRKITTHEGKIFQGNQQDAIIISIIKKNLEKQSYIQDIK